MLECRSKHTRNLYFLFCTVWGYFNRASQTANRFKSKRVVTSAYWANGLCTRLCGFEPCVLVDGLFVPSTRTHLYTFFRSNGIFVQINIFTHYRPSFCIFCIFVRMLTSFGYRKKPKFFIFIFVICKSKNAPFGASGSGTAKTLLNIWM